MKLRLRSKVWAVLFSVPIGLTAAGVPAAYAQAANPASPSQSAEQSQAAKQGTGVVPPGVKLVPEMPAGGLAKPFHFPTVAMRTLSNGLRVFVASDHRDPAVAARLVLTSAGTIRDPVGMPGVASMTASLLTQGTEKRSAQQIAEAIDFVGGSLNTGAAGDATFVSVAVVRKDLGLGMDLLSDVVLHPAFKSEELERQRQQLLSGLEASYADPNYLASAAFERIVYGAAPYGLPEEGTPESARKLDRDTLARFHDANYAPNQALLAFAGDVSPEEAFAAAEKYFGGWAKKDVAAPEPAAPEAARGMRIVVIDKPDAVQTQIRIGRLGIRRNSPEYIPLYVSNRIFGGGYNSRLNTEVRIHKGLTYGANSSFASHRYAGAFVADTFTRTEATVEATKLVVDLIEKMGTGEVEPAELKFAKDYLAGVYPIQSETAEQVADRVLIVAEYGLPADYNETYQEKILAVTPAQVKEMAQRYFNARDLDVVLVGNVSQFRDALKKDFPGAKWEEIPLDQIDLARLDLRRPKDAVPAATPESLERGSELLKTAAQAAGGTAIRPVQSLEFTASGKLFAQGQELTFDLKVEIAYPDRVRIETKSPMGQSAQGFDGKSGWWASAQGTIDAPERFNTEFQRSIALTGGLGLYQQVLAGKVEAQFLGEEEVEGQKREAVEWKAPFEAVKLYFDPSTHRLVGARFGSAVQQGSLEVEQRWSDFRNVQGIEYPFHVVAYREGDKFSETLVQEVKLNTNPDPSEFTKPQPPAPPK
jgi:zinc protease